MGVPIGGCTVQLLCVGMDGAVALYGNSSVILMQSGCSVPLNVKNSFWDSLCSALGMQYGCSYCWQNRAVVVCGDGWTVALYGGSSVMGMQSGCLVPINVKNGFWDALGSALAMQYGLCVGMDGAVELYGSSSVMLVFGTYKCQKRFLERPW